MGTPGGDDIDADVIDLHGRLRSTLARWDRGAAMVGAHIDVAARSYVSWSGGKDSTAVALLAEAFHLPVVYVSHGVDFPEVMQYCAEVAAARGWDYRVARLPWPTEFFARGDVDAHDPSTYTADVLTVLDSAPAGFLYGLRRDESTGRHKLLCSTKGYFARADGQRVCAPIWDWSRLDVLAYLRHQDVEPCPIYATLAALGCPEEAQRVSVMVGGGGSHAGRYVWLRRGWPDLWQELVTALPRLAEMS